MAEEKFEAGGGLSTEGDIDVTGNVDGVKVADLNSNFNNHTADPNPHNIDANKVGLGNVENVALSTWQGNPNINEVGTLNNLNVLQPLNIPDVYFSKVFTTSFGVDQRQYLRVNTALTYNNLDEFYIILSVLSRATGGDYHGALIRTYALETYQGIIYKQSVETEKVIGGIGEYARIGDFELDGSGFLQVPVYFSESAREVTIKIEVWGRQRALDIFSGVALTALESATIPPKQYKTIIGRLGINKEPDHDLDINGSVNVGTDYKISGNPLSYSDVGAAALNHNHDGDYEPVLGTINPPLNMVLTDNGNFINIAFDQSTTPNIDTYEIWRSETSSSSGFSLIGFIKKDDVTPTMNFADDLFSKKTTLYYKIYAAHHGVRSVALSGQVTAAGDVADVSNLQVQANRSAYYLTYDIPYDTRLDHIEIKVDVNTDSGNLSESNATLVYSGNSSTFLYMVQPANRNKYHQFWIYTITKV